MKPKNIPGVPKHYKGSYHDTESIKNIEKHEDIDFQFNILKQRFFAINNWRKYCPEALQILSFLIPRESSQKGFPK
ncbi:hypothetical protein [Chryseobacterium taihuense]|uniref:hypothetical protein n=1 Tax=Chryseobacterium taihuense TaxID=1141221 RepID=UPI00115F85B3|nr:hypothetical protein [Chryseobacterium taihuense]